MSQQTIGRRLREAREAIPASVYQASRETKIRADFLDCMEADNFEFVSGGPYVKGMLRAYGKWLRLDEQQLFDTYERLQGQIPEPSVSRVLPEPANIPPRKRPHWMMAAVSAGAILLVLSLVGVMRPSQNVAPPPVTSKEAAEDENSSKAAKDALSQGAPSEAGAGLADGVKVTLTVIGDRSWVEAYTDLPGGGRQLAYKGMLPAGTAKTFEAKDQVQARIGNLGAVRLSLNGRDLGVPGLPGQVGNFVFKPGTTDLVRP